MQDEGQNGPLLSPNLTSCRAETAESHLVTSHSLSLIEVETELALHGIIILFSNSNLQKSRMCLLTAKDTSSDHV